MQARPWQISDIQQTFFERDLRLSRDREGRRREIRSLSTQVNGSLFGFPTSERSIQSHIAQRVLISMRDRDPPIRLTMAVLRSYRSLSGCRMALVVIHGFNHRHGHVRVFIDFLLRFPRLYAV